MKKETTKPLKIKTNCVIMPVGLFLAHSFVMVMVGDLLCKKALRNKFDSAVDDISNKKKNSVSYCKDITLKFNSQSEAEEFFDKISEMVQKYEYVSVADVIDMGGKDSHYLDHFFGWKTLTGTYNTDSYTGECTLNLGKPSFIKF